MSTTVTITPVTETSVGIGAAVAPLVLAGIGLWAVAKVLSAADQDCRRLLEASRDDVRNERIAAIQLRTPDLDRLIRSATEANYASRSLSAQAVRIDSAGEPVWATRTASGVTLLGREQAVHRLLVANTNSRVVEHLKGRGFSVETDRRASGAVRMVATGRRQEIIDVKVSSDGEAAVDPLNYSDRSCETVVNDMAAALDGSITKSCRKPEFFGGGVRLTGSKTRA